MRFGLPWVIAGDLPLWCGSTCLDVRFQDKDPILALWTLIHSLLGLSVRARFVGTEVAAHALLYPSERRLVVAVGADQIGLQWCVLAGVCGQKHFVVTRSLHNYILV